MTAGYMFAPEIETLPRDRLAALQLERLKATLGRAYENVAHYKKSFDAAGVGPGNLKRLDDLVRFPFTVKDDLRATYPFGMFAVPRDVVHNAYGYGLFTAGLGAHYGAERLGCTVVPVSGGFTERQITLLRDLGARVLCATPSYALNLAEVASQAGADLRGGPLEIGIFGAEPWSEALRAELDRRLGILAVDIYGLSEIIGPGVAAECVEERAGLHVWEDCFLVEIIDPETGEPVATGEAGELVITTLAKQAQPMIRYRTRDITRLDDGPCACGRSHRRILRITGRSDDMLIIRGVNLYPSQVEAVLIGRPDIGPHYQLVVRRDGAMDALTVEVEAQPGVPAGRYPDLAADVMRQVKSRLGVSCQAVVLEPGQVPRSQGKAVHVRDLRTE